MKISHLFSVVAVCIAVVMGAAACAGGGSGAEALLDDVRGAMHAGRFDEARRLIDSLRTTYPKEFDVRRSALVLSDSVELLEAGVLKQEIDSVLTFRRLELDDAKAGFVLEKQERFQSLGYYVLPKYAGSKAAYRMFPEVEESGKMLIVTIGSDRKYTFTEVPVADEGYLPYIGGMDLTDEQQYDVAACYRLASLFSQCKVLAEQQEKMSLKIRFYEKKMGGS